MFLNRMRLKSLFEHTQFISSIGLQAFDYVLGFVSLIHSFAIRPLRSKRKKTLAIVHVGKCGGTSVRQAVKKSRVVKNRYIRVRRFHFEKPYFSDDFDYLFVLRSPLRRAVSAFNYRHAHVVQLGTEATRFEGEREVLLNFESLSDLAEIVISDGEVLPEGLAAWSRIHHLGDESFETYLDPLVTQISKEQIFGVFLTNRLGSDIRRKLFVKPVKRRDSSQFPRPGDKRLTSLAEQNLRALLAKDFSLLVALTEKLGLRQRRAMSVELELDAENKRVQRTRRG
jgi:hypothetical protein